MMTILFFWNTAFEIKNWKQKGLLPFLAVPINWSSIARICSEADMMEISTEIKAASSVYLD